jgi:hypothetical protein
MEGRFRYILSIISLWYLTAMSRVLKLDLLEGQEDRSPSPFPDAGNVFCKWCAAHKDKMRTWPQIIQFFVSADPGGR